MNTPNKTKAPTGEMTPDLSTSARHQLLPRRTILKAGAVSVAGLTIGTSANLLPSLAHEAAASPSPILKIGAVVSPPTRNPSTNAIEFTPAPYAPSPPRNDGPCGVIEKARILNLMGATSVRIAQYWDNRGPWFTYEQLDALIGTNTKTGGALRTEVFLTSKETLGAGTADVAAQAGWIRDYVNRVNTFASGISFVFEIGNEPNEPNDLGGKYAGGATEARQRALTWLQYLNNNAGSFPSNLYWAVNMPSNNADSNYFNTFTAYDSFYGGSVLNPANQNRYYMVTTHVYGADDYTPGDPGTPYKITSWVRGAANDQGRPKLSIRFSETGVHSPLSGVQRVNLYNDFIKTKPYELPSIFGNGTDNPNDFNAGSAVTTACFFSTPPIAPPLNQPDDGTKGEQPYQIFRPEAKALGRLLPLYYDFPTNAGEADRLHEMSGLGITRGYGGGYFYPNDPVSRQQMASLICRSIPSDTGSMPGIGPNTWANEGHWQNLFADIYSAAPPHRENIQTIRYYGVTNGYGDNTFDPGGLVTNAQTVSFITRALVNKGYWPAYGDNPNFMPNTFSNSSYTGHRIDAVRYNTVRGFIPEAYDSPAWWGANTTRRLFSEILAFALDTAFYIFDSGYLRKRP